jgi:hypothetical protein
MSTRRDALTVTYDRQRILDHVNSSGGNMIRRESWMRPSDITALVRSGELRSEVVREWDSSTGYQANMFGGAAVMQRKRMYLYST